LPLSRANSTWRRRPHVSAPDIFEIASCASRVSSKSMNANPCLYAMFVIGPNWLNSSLSCASATA